MVAIPTSLIFEVNQEATTWKITIPAKDMDNYPVLAMYDGEEGIEDFLNMFDFWCTKGKIELIKSE